MSSVKIAGDTSGLITLAAPAAAGTNTITMPASTGTMALTSDVPGAAKISQILSTIKTDTFSTSSFTFVDVTGLSVAITPSASSSKIYIMLSISGGGMSGFRYQLVRGSTAIAIGTGSIGSRVAGSGGGSNRNYDEVDNACSNFLDSPSTTSATTYKVQVSTGAGSTDSKINATRNDPDSTTGFRTASTITVMEVTA